MRLHKLVMMMKTDRLKRFVSNVVNIFDHCLAVMQDKTLHYNGLHTVT